MSWQWIPAELDVNPHNSGSEPTLTETINGWRPGYYIGEGNDDGYYIVNAAGYRNFGTSDPNWIVTTYPYQQFSVSACTSADSVVSEFIMDFNAENQMFYFGKPVYYGNNYVLKYSPTNGSYVIMTRDYSSVRSEPVYSVNVLSGGLSGDHYWIGNVTDLDLDVGTRYGPITFALIGAVDQYKDSNPSYIAHFLLESKINYYKYIDNSGDQLPAGKYEHSETGETITVGSQTYAGDDGSIWIGHHLSSTEIGTMDSPYFQSNHGRLYYAESTEYWGNCWKTNAAAEAPVFIYRTSQSDPSKLPNSFTLSYYVWDSDLSTYKINSDGNITLTLGPYQLLSVESSIMMGEVSQWR